MIEHQIPLYDGRILVLTETELIAIQRYMDECRIRVFLDGYMNINRFRTKYPGLSLTEDDRRFITECVCRTYMIPYPLTMGDFEMLDYGIEKLLMIKENYHA